MNNIHVGESKRVKSKYHLWKGRIPWMMYHLYQYVRHGSPEICPSSKKNLNASRPSEHPSIREENVKTFRWGHTYICFPDLLQYARFHFGDIRILESRLILYTMPTNVWNSSHHIKFRRLGINPIWPASPAEQGKICFSAPVRA